MPRKPITTAEYANKVRCITNGEYELVSEYINSNSNITLKHLKCGNEYTVKVHTFATGRRCPYCNKQINKGTEKFKKEVYKKFNGEYEVIGEYKTAKEKIEIKHNKCGFIFKAIPDKLINSKKQCPYCLKEKNKIKYRKTHEQFVKEVYKKVKDEYTVIGEYETNNTKIELKHNKCGKNFYVLPTHFLTQKNYTRCPFCKSSKGEKKIEDFCIKNNLNYKTQYKIKQCRNKKELPFDFAIFNKNKLLCLIEYDGELHYKAIDFFGGEEALLYRQKCDNIKNEFCKNNSIKLIRIPYTIEDVEEYLNKELNKLNNDIN